MDTEANLRIMTMKISEKTIIALIIRAKSQPGEYLALVAERYKTLREVQWPAIRHVARLSLSTSEQAISNAEMSLTFENRSQIRCFSADRPGCAVSTWPLSTDVLHRSVRDER